DPRPRRGRPPPRGGGAGRRRAPPPTSPAPTRGHRSRPPSPARAPGSCPGRRPSRGGRSYGRPDEVETGQQVVRGQVLERGKAVAEHAHLLDREQRAVTIERRDRLAQTEVARRPGLRPGEMAREVPVGGPLAEAANGHERRFDLVVGKALDR